MTKAEALVSMVQWGNIFAQNGSGYRFNSKLNKFEIFVVIGRHWLFDDPNTWPSDSYELTHDPLNPPKPPPWEQKADKPEERIEALEKRIAMLENLYACKASYERR